MYVLSMKQSKVTICIPQATEKGYIECPVWGVFDWNYPKSKLRRGRVQGGGRISPTIMCNGNALHAIVAYETE